MSDCAECRALLALLIANDEDWAIMELRHLGPRARAGGSALELVDFDDMRRRQAVKLLLAAGTAAGGLDLERLASILAGTRWMRPAWTTSKR